jgi:hypothetical protein
MTSGSYTGNWLRSSSERLALAGTLDAGHYPWEDAADEYAALVTRLVAGRLRECREVRRRVATTALDALRVRR